MIKILNDISKFFSENSDYPNFKGSTRIDLWHYSFDKKELLEWITKNTTVKDIVRYEDDNEFFIFFNNDNEIKEFNKWIKDREK